MEKKTFYNLEEMQKYRHTNTDLYEFVEDGKLIDIEIAFDLVFYGDIKAKNITAGDIKAFNLTAENIVSCNIVAEDITACSLTAGNISACDINAKDIKASNISAWDINSRNIEAENIDAFNITAWDIDFYAVCFTYNNIVCKTIAGRRVNSKYFSLDGEVIVNGNKE